MARLAVLLALAVCASAAPVAHLGRALPTPVAASTARTYLAALTVAVDSNSPAYARDKFKTWDMSECDSAHAMHGSLMCMPSLRHVRHARDGAQARRDECCDGQQLQRDLRQLGLAVRRRRHYARKRPRYRKPAPRVEPP